MFDALAPFIIIAVTFVINGGLNWLNKQGFPLSGKDWPAIFAAAFAAATVAYLNAAVVHLPSLFQTILPLFIQALVYWLSSMGLHSVAKHAVQTGKKALAKR